MKAAQDQVWAYLHDELKKDQRERFEQELSENLLLQEALNEKRVSHEHMMKVLPKLRIIESNHEPELDEDALIAEWESEFPEYTHSAQPSGSKIIRFSIVPLAAAAAVTFALFMLQPNEVIRWDNTSFGSAPAIRGNETSISAYDKSDIKTAIQTLQQNIESEVPEAQDPWKLKVSFQELAKGSMAVEVSGFPKGDSDRKKVWSNSYSNLDHFKADIPMFSKRVINDLTEQTN